MNEERARESNPELVDLIRRAIIQDGPISFARFMEMALYHPRLGYYSGNVRRPGRAGDFLTSPEVSPLFGISLAQQLVEFWSRLGRPDAWHVVEHGAGIGGLAYDIMAGLHDIEPGAFDSLTYHMVETNPHLRSQADESMAESGLAEKAKAHDPAVPLSGIRAGVLIGNEIADALPFHRVQIDNNGNSLEIGVGWQDGWFTDAPVSMAGDVSKAIESIRRSGIDLPPGSRLEISPEASCWFANALAQFERGFAMVIDYGYLVHERYAGHRLEGLVRGYAGQRVTDDPYVSVGNQDLTTHVDFSALIAAAHDAGFSLGGMASQADLLVRLGLGDRLVQLQREPATSLPDYVSASQSVVRLIDPAGLGRFNVLIMGKDVPLEPPLRGLDPAWDRFDIPSG